MLRGLAGADDGDAVPSSRVSVIEPSGQRDEGVGVRGAGGEEAEGDGGEHRAGGLSPRRRPLVECVHVVPLEGRGFAGREMGVWSKSRVSRC